MIPKSLTNAFHNKRLIPIVGAGASMSILNLEGKPAFPSWTGLLYKIAATLRLEGKVTNANVLESLVELKHFKEAAAIAKSGLSGPLWSSFFKETFGINQSTILSSSLDLPKAIWTISDRVITLNYDKILRNSAPAPEGVLEIDNACRSELADFCRGSLQYPSIWHLHGRIDNVEGIIFTTDSYDQLYTMSDPTYAAAIEAFRTLIRNSSLIFVGCSLDDADILQQIAREHKIFDGNTGPHYALVRAAEVELVKAKLGDFPVDIVEFSQFGTPLIDKIAEITHTGTETPASTVHMPPSSVVRKSRTTVLSAHPINKSAEYLDELRELRKLKGDVEYKSLTLSNLNNLTDTDNVIILTKTIKDQLLIEDETLGSGLVSIEEIQGNLGCTVSSLTILTDCAVDLLPRVTTGLQLLPTHIIPSLTKSQLESLCFRVFRRRELNFIPGCVAIMPEALQRIEFIGQYQEVRKKTPLPDNIDPKTTYSYVGRKTDLENLARVIANLRDRNELLTIKGSGGIGKTATVKKLAVEFSARCFFKDGISFIDCDTVVDFKNLEHIIAVNLNLDLTQEIKRQVRESCASSNLLIILDNAETLLHLRDRDQIVDLISFLSNFATVIVTSREVLSIDCEYVYELRPFTTDEAYELFAKEYGESKIKTAEQPFVRQEILEALLDNNPLAIKLITRNIPKGKNFEELKNELQDDIFRRLSDVELNAFDAPSDVNIERKKSLYASINYSYNHLDEREKKTFELLSLFPDGINIENFKRISSTSASLKGNGAQRSTSLDLRNSLITDKVLRSLENKSMIQVDNDILKLQSIVGRFADQKLNSREAHEISRYYRNAFHFNSGLARMLSEIHRYDYQMTVRTTNSHRSNFIKSLQYSAYAEIQTSALVTYLTDLMKLFKCICVGRTLLEAIDRNQLGDIEEGKLKLCYQVARLNCLYYSGDFSRSLRELQSILPLHQLEGLNYNDDIEGLTVANASEIYCCEGDAFPVAKLDAAGRFIYLGYPLSLFLIGEIDRDLALESPPDFITFEALSALGIANEKFINDYLSQLHAASSLERIQTLYAKSKISPLPKSVINRIVPVNPYTAGLKSLMYAFSEKDPEKKEAYFDAALELLQHIRYYYVECIYFYSIFKLECGRHDEYLHLSKQALELAEKHCYRYLTHRVRSLSTSTKENYVSDTSKLPEQYDFSEYIAFFRRKLKSARKAIGQSRRN